MYFVNSKLVLFRCSNNFCVKPAKLAFIFRNKWFIRRVLLSTLIVAVKEMRLKIIVEHLTNLQQSLKISVISESP